MAKVRAKWNPSHHPRDARGRFTRSSTRVMKPEDRKRAAAGQSGFKPAELADQAARAEWLQRTSAASPSPSSAIARYLDGGWRTDNPALRAGKPVDDVDQLDAAFAELDDDVMLRRIVPAAMFAHIPISDLVGMKVRDAAPASTSLDHTGPGHPGAVTMHIAAPAGTRAYVNDDAGEVLLMRDTEVAITRAVQRPDGNGWDLYGALIPRKDTPTRPARPAGDDQSDEQPATADTPTAGTSAPDAGDNAPAGDDQQDAAAGAPPADTADTAGADTEPGTPVGKTPDDTDAEELTLDPAHVLSHSYKNARPVAGARTFVQPDGTFRVSARSVQDGRTAYERGVAQMRKDFPDITPPDTYEVRVRGTKGRTPDAATGGRIDERTGDIVVTLTSDEPQQPAKAGTSTPGAAKDSGGEDDGRVTTTAAPAAAPARPARKAAPEPAGNDQDPARLAEPGELPGDARTLAEVLDNGLPADAVGQEQIRAFLHSRAGRFTDPKSGITAEPGSVKIAGGEISYRFALRNDDGEKIGSVKRTFGMNRTAGGPYVVNQHMDIDDVSLRGGGFATRFNARNEQVWHANGIDQVRLTANTDVGGYAWARAGYDFEHVYAANDLGEHLDVLLRGERPGGVLAEGSVAATYTADEWDDATRAAAADLVARSRAAMARYDELAGGGKFGAGDAANAEAIQLAPTPLEFAMLGWTPGTGGGKAAMWPGKGFMLGRQWNGVKDLRPPPTDDASPAVDTPETPAAGTGTPTVDGTVLSRDALGSGRQQEMNDVAAAAVAARWDVTDADLEALSREEGNWERISQLPADQRRTAVAREQISRWNGSSGAPLSVAIAVAASDRAGRGYTLSDRETRTQAYIADRPAVARAASSLGAAMYDETQAWFAARGITSVRLHRSGRDTTADDSRPFTSWSVDGAGTAAGAGYSRREEEIPTARVLSVPATGFGNIEEGEVVVLPATPRPADTPEAPDDAALARQLVADGLARPGRDGTVTAPPPGQDPGEWVAGLSAVDLVAAGNRSQSRTVKTAILDEQDRRRAADEQAGAGVERPDPRQDPQGYVRVLGDYELAELAVRRGALPRLKKAAAAEIERRKMSPEELAADQRLDASVSNPTRGKWADLGLTSGDRIIFFGDKVRAKDRGEVATVTLDGGRDLSFTIRGEDDDSTLLMRLKAGDRFWMAPVDAPEQAGDGQGQDTPGTPAAASDTQTPTAGTTAPDVAPPADVATPDLATVTTPAPADPDTLLATPTITDQDSDPNVTVRTFDPALSRPRIVERVQIGDQELYAVQAALVTQDRIDDPPTLSYGTQVFLVSADQQFKQLSVTHYKQAAYGTPAGGKAYGTNDLATPMNSRGDFANWGSGDNLDAAIADAKRRYDRDAVIDTFGPIASRNVGVHDQDDFDQLDAAADIQVGDLVVLRSFNKLRTGVATKVTRGKVEALVATPSNPLAPSGANATKGTGVRLLRKMDGPARPAPATVTRGLDGGTPAPPDVDTPPARDVTPAAPDTTAPETPETPAAGSGTPTPDGTAVRPARIKMDDPQYKRDYDRGWRTSKTAGSDSLERGDARGEPEAWYDGWSDYSVDQPRWSTPRKDDAEERARVAGEPLYAVVSYNAAGQPSGFEVVRGRERLEMAWAADHIEPAQRALDDDGRGTAKRGRVGYVEWGPVAEDQAGLLGSGPLPAGAGRGIPPFLPRTGDGTTDGAVTVRPGNDPRPVTFPKLWHVTRSSDGAAGIRKNGLQVGGGDSDGAHFGAGIYLSADETAAERYFDGAHGAEDARAEHQFTAQARVTNPFRVDAAPDDKNGTTLLINRMAAEGLARRGEKLTPQEITDRLRTAGYDSVYVYQPEMDDFYGDNIGGSQLLVFDAADVEITDAPGAADNQLPEVPTRVKPIDDGAAGFLRYAINNNGGQVRNPDVVKSLRAAGFVDSDGTINAEGHAALRAYDPDLYAREMTAAGLTDPNKAAADNAVAAAELQDPAAGTSAPEAPATAAPDAGGDAFAAMLDRQPKTVSRAVTGDGTRPGATEVDMFGNVTAFVPARREAIGLADRPDVGRTRAIAAVQQLGMFDRAEMAGNPDGQTAMFDALLTMPAADPPPDVSAPAVDAPEADRRDALAARILDEGLAGWNDEQLSGAFLDLSSGDTVDDDHAAAMQRIEVEWVAREQEMLARAAQVPADLTALSDDDAVALLVQLTSSDGVLDDAVVARVTADLDRREAAAAAANETARLRALADQDPATMTTDADFEAASQAATDLADWDAFDRIMAGWSAHETARSAREEADRVEAARIETERLEAARVATEAAAAREAAAAAEAERERTTNAMIAARAAAAIPATDDASVRSAHQALGEDGTRRVLGAEKYDRIAAAADNGPLQGEDARRYAIRAALLRLDEEDRSRLVLAAADIDTPDDIRAMGDGELMMATLIEGVPMSGETPEQAGERTARLRAVNAEQNRRAMLQLVSQGALEYARYREKLRTSPVDQLTDVELAGAPGTLAADPDSALLGKLAEIRAEADRRETAAADKANRKAAGPTAPARLANPIGEFGDLTMRTEGYRDTDYGREAGSRLLQARALTVGLPPTATEQDIRKAEKADERSQYEKAAWAIAWYRHLAEFSEIADGYRNVEWVSGPADEADVPDVPMPLPGAKVAKPVDVWEAMKQQAIYDRRAGIEDGARRYTMALARSYGIPFDPADRSDDAMRRLGSQVADAQRGDPRTAAQRAASYIAEWRRLAATDGVDPGNHLLYGPPDKRPANLPRTQWAPTADEEIRVDRLVSQGWEWDEAFAFIMGIDADELRRERAASAATGTARPTDKIIKAHYAEHVTRQYLDAENATNGYLLNKTGTAKGIDPETLFSGDPERAYRYASEELMRWWAEHPRLTYADYKAQLVGDGKAARRQTAQASKGNQFA